MRIVMPFVLVIVCTSALAQTYSSTTGKVTRLGTGVSGEGVYITLDVSSATSCSTPHTFYLARTAPQYKEVFATALVAWSQNRSLDVWHSGTCAAGNVNISAVALRN